jgi:dihydrofolate reductase
MSEPLSKSLIVALTAANTIGPDGESTLGWTAPEDKAWFRSITKMVGTVVMGRKTFETIGRKPLPGRMNYVLTRDSSAIVMIEGQLRALTLDEFRALKLPRFCVIGGLDVYKQMWNETEVIYISRHKKVYTDGPVFNLDLTHTVLFSRQEVGEIIKEIYTKPPFVSPEIECSYDDNEFIDAAERAAVELSLAPTHRTGAVLVKDGKIIGRGANGSNWHEQHANDPELKDFGGCMRKKLKSPTGQEYEKCEGCSPINHSEPRVVKNARDNGHDPAGATCYLWGHWWYCEPCSKALLGAGVKKMVLPRTWTKDFLGICTD